MKRFLLMLAATALLNACKDDKKTDAEKTAASTATTPDKAAVTYPLPVSYSSSFEMGNPAYAAMIAQGSWKDWEQNSMTNMKSWVADTVMTISADNKVTKGVDSLQAHWIKGRADYTSVIDTINAIMPVYSTDKKENWVLVWAKEINVNAKGVKDTVEIMETWRINKDGKADFVLQYDRHARKM